MSKQPLIRRAAYTLLTRRDYAQQEITQKLQVKGYPRDEIDLVIADLVQSGLINEERFIENYIHWRKAKGFGPLHIAMELKARGISEERIAKHLQITDNAWFTEARKAREKHFKGCLPSDFKSRAKQMRFLQQRGFTSEQIKSVFHEINAEFD